MAESEDKYKRPSWDEYFIEVMESIARRGTCDRGRSGCVITKNNQIVSAGYVGSPIGEDHCDEVGHLFQKRYDADGNYSMHCVRTVHAEQNAICQAAKNGTPIDGATLYCKMTPCPICAKMIINCGIQRVVCLRRYHDGAESERLFLRAGVALEHVSEEEEQYAGKGTKDEKEEWRPAPLGDNRIEPISSDVLNIKIKRLNDEAVIPSFAYDNDAGMDLYSTEDVEIPAGSRAKISTGLAFEIPRDYVGLIWDRSSVPIKKGLKTVGGVVDSGYRGELYVGMANVSKEPVEVSKGEKIAQMVIQKFFQPQIEVTDELAESERADKTQGSSDLKQIDPIEDLGLDYLPEDEPEADDALAEAQIFEEIIGKEINVSSDDHFDVGVPTGSSDVDSTESRQDRRDVGVKKEGQDGKSRW